MKNIFPLLIALIGLSACTKNDASVRVTNDRPPAAPVVAPQQARSEPIFYNGKTYNLKFAPTNAGVYDVAVNGMSAKQQKDATAVATSAIRYFACPDGKTGKLIEQPRYDGSAWRMSARCG
jgi:hypothetical protein